MKSVVRSLFTISVSLAFSLYALDLWIDHQLLTRYPTTYDLAVLIVLGVMWLEARRMGEKRTIWFRTNEEAAAALRSIVDAARERKAS